MSKLFLNSRVSQSAHHPAQSDPKMRKPPYVTKPIVCRRNTIFDPTAKAIMSYQGTQVSTMEDLTMLWSIMANKMEC